MKARKLSTFSLLMAAVAFSAVSVFAANTSSSVKARIESAQKSGKVSREAIVQFRADQDLIDKKEADIRAKHDGLLPARHGVTLLNGFGVDGLKRLYAFSHLGGIYRLIQR